MANIFNDIRTSIHNFLVGSSNSFRTVITQTVDSTDYYKLYFNQATRLAPTTTTQLSLPYVVFDLLPITTNRDSASKSYTFNLQFRIAALSIDDAEDVAGYLIDLLEDSESSLTITNYNLITIDKDPIIPLGKSDNVWSIIVPYRLHIEN